MEKTDIFTYFKLFELFILKGDDMVDSKTIIIEDANLRSNLSGEGLIETVQDIQNVLENPSLSQEEKIMKIAKAGTPVTKFASVMIDYQKKMSKNAASVEASEGAANNYNLYSRLAKVCKTENYTEFKVLFDVVNFIFEMYKDDAYSEFLLHRYDMQWTWGDKQLRTYQHLVTMLCVLCERSKRKELMKTISLNKVLDLDRTVFTETMVSNIRRYYEE